MIWPVRSELSLGGSVCAVLATVGATWAQNADPAPPSGATPLPPIRVTAPKRAPAAHGRKPARETNAPAAAAPAASPAVQPPPDLGVGNNAGPTVPPLQQV